MQNVPFIASEEEAHLNLFLKLLSHEAIARLKIMTPKQSKYRLHKLMAKFGVAGRNGLLSLIVSSGITFQDHNGVIKTLRLSCEHGSNPETKQHN